MTGPDTTPHDAVPPGFQPRAPRAPRPTRRLTPRSPWPEPELVTVKVTINLLPPTPSYRPHRPVAARRPHRLSTHILLALTTAGIGNYLYARHLGDQGWAAHVLLALTTLGAGNYLYAENRRGRRP
jgi:hypothetical protein